MACELLTPDYETTLGDTADIFTATLTDEGGALNLTGAAVTLVLRHRTTRAREELPMTLQDPVNGIVARAWADGFPSAGAGYYDAQFRVDFDGGLVAYLPNRGDAELEEFMLIRIRSPL